MNLVTAGSGLLSPITSGYLTGAKPGSEIVLSYRMS